MLITLSRRSAICQSVIESLVDWCDPLGAVSHIFFNFIIIINIIMSYIKSSRNE